MDLLPNYIPHHMETFWRLTTITFYQADLFDLLLDGHLRITWLTRMSSLKDIRFVETEGSYVDSEVMEEQIGHGDKKLAEPETLHIDMTASGVSILHLLLRDDPVLFSVANVKRLTISFTDEDEDEVDHIERDICRLLSKVSSPLDELTFRYPDVR